MRIRYVLALLIVVYLISIELTEFDLQIVVLPPLFQLNVLSLIQK